MNTILKRVVVMGLLTIGLAATTSGVAATQAATERTVTRKITPLYPSAARVARLKGTVKLSLVVTLDGKVKSVDVIGGHPVFVEAASYAAKQWRYEPAAKESSETLVFVFEAP